MREKIFHKLFVGILLPVCGLVSMVSCSTTSAIEDGEQLFTGLKRIDYVNYEKNQHAKDTQVEMEYVLASAPNAALFGSSYYSSPLPIKLWIWNAFSQGDDDFSRWMTKAFGSKPKLMSEVNPRMRAQVATSQLKKFGYFDGKVDYDVVEQRNPKKAKVAYTVDMGRLWTIDTLRYTNFTPDADSLIRASSADKLIKNGDAFDVPVLELERQRITRLLRDNGYYLYNNGYATYLADTISRKGSADMCLHLADSLDEGVMRKWYIGKIDINLRQRMMEPLTDSLQRRNATLHFAGRRPRIRPGVILRDLKLRRGNLYSVSAEESSIRSLQNQGLFSNLNFRFATRGDSLSADSLDLVIDCTLDKPYDVYVEANAVGKTTSRIGPQIVTGITKRNAFRGGEKLDINAHGSYEWQTGHNAEGTSSGVNSYEYGGDVSLVFPRLITPKSIWNMLSRRDSVNYRRSRHRYYTTPSTTIKASMNTISRAGYFKRHVVSGEFTYDFRTSAQTSHSFSPLIITYEYMKSQTDDFLELLDENPYLKVSMQDQFVPKMSYTWRYSTAVRHHSPLNAQVTVSEAGNLLSLCHVVGGDSWNEKGKKLFKNPFAQFVRLEADVSKLWRLSEHESFVAHASCGVIYSYGNSEQAPYFEQFYVGGANSIRAFNMRSIGPGRYRPSSSRMSYIEQTGDVKFLANLEYRPRLWGKLHAAIFLDAGNVWTIYNDDNRPEAKFDFKDVFDELAVGTGAGLRYDMGLFVIRLDWGIGLHLPYDTGKSGFYNIPSFHDGQSIHLAVGYPF